jgi:hypothetical protein
MSAIKIQTPGNVSLPARISPPMSKFRVKNPLPAMLRDPGGRHEYVSLPIGAVVTTLKAFSAPIVGMFSVIWEQREYAVLATDLVRKCDPFTA